MDLLQSSLKGEPVSIGKDIMTRMAENLNSRPASAAIGTLFKKKMWSVNAALEYIFTLRRLNMGHF